ncbi:MAG: hypothetical protein KDK51_07995 [Deltaproteobacteria bacterium]|nr:hypothetical protein [Deltaproteobacteria bacterium]
MSSYYRSLDIVGIRNTIERLSMRIHERFADSGLYKVSQELQILADQTQAKIIDVKKPNWYLRTVLVLLVALIILGLIAIGVRMSTAENTPGFWELIQILESGVNDLVFVGIFVIFLFSAENRIKRKRILQTLHELRAFAHVVDMHQLTKDIEHLPGANHRTKSSPVLDFTNFELKRYLDYCSEMLSIISKLAALQAQNFQDEVVLSTVTEIEYLTSGLSRKIWQKITILSNYKDSEITSQENKPLSQEQ